MAKKKVKNATPTCAPMNHLGCCGVGMIVLGILILLNAIYGWFSWGVFIGGIAILKGIVLLIHKKMCV